jgi:hypothetical protein
MNLLLLLIALSSVITAVTMLLSTEGKYKTALRRPIRRRMFGRIIPRKRFTRNFKILMICAVASIVVSILYYYLNNKAENKKEYEAAEQQRSRDSIIQFKTDSIARETIAFLTEELRKNGLKYDSAQKTIERLVTDSAIRNTTYISSEDPIVDVCIPDGLIIRRQDYELYLYNFIVKLCVTGAGARDIQLFATVILSDSVQTPIKSFGKKQLFERPAMLSPDKLFGVEFPVRVKSVRNPSFIVYFEGTYSNSTETKKYPIDQMCFVKYPDGGEGIHYVINRRRVLLFLKN